MRGFHVFTLPPSTASVWPVTKSLSAEARKISAPRRSWGCWSLCSARDATARSRAVFTWPGFSATIVSLSVKPGISVLTRDAVVAELARHRARHRHDAALAGDVVHDPRDAAHRRARSDVDDLAVFALRHLGRNMFRHQKRPAQI